MKLETHVTPGQVEHVKEFGSILRVRENQCRVSCGGAWSDLVFEITPCCAENGVVVHPFEGTG